MAADPMHELSEHLAGQKRWLDIAALETDPDRRKDALRESDVYRDRAVDLVVGAALSPNTVRTLMGCEPAAEAAERERRHQPLRRMHAAYQQTMIAYGEWMLKSFPFLRPPIEWMAERLNRLALRLGL
jgi:hypothetical protein